MAGGGGSSREQNFWPGFVDALTNLVLVLVFVVVVFTFALFYFASQLAKGKIQEAKEQYQRAAIEKALLKEELSKMRGVQTPSHSAQITSSNGASQLSTRVDVERDASQLPPSKDVLPVVVTGRGGAVVVNFAPGVADLSAKEDSAIDAALGKPNPAVQYELTAEPAEVSPSEGRRLAFYRIAAIRNHLVQAGVAPERIDMVIGDPAPPGTPRSRVVIRTRAAGAP